MSASPPSPSLPPRPKPGAFSSRVPVPPGAFVFRHVVQPDELDELNHANNLEFMKWMVAAATAHSDSVGWTGTRYQELQSGWVVRTHQIEYLQPAYLGEEVAVHTWVVDMKWMTSMRRYVLMRPSDQARLAVAVTNWAYIDFKTKKLARIPEIVSAAYPMIPDQPL